MAMALNFNVVILDAADSAATVLSADDFFDAPKTVLSPADLIIALQLPTERVCSLFTCLSSIL